MDLFARIYRRTFRAVCGKIVVISSAKWSAVLNYAGGIVDETLVNAILEGWNIPAVQEVTAYYLISYGDGKISRSLPMKAKASRISIAKDVMATIGLVNFIHRVKNFIE